MQITAQELARALEEGRATVRPEADEIYWDNGDGCANSGAAWPDTILTISLGDWRVDVPVWLVCAYERGRWTYDHSDGVFSGRPTVDVERDECGELLRHRSPCAQTKIMRGVRHRPRCSRGPLSL